MDTTSAAIQRQGQDSNSNGSLFSARADLITQQIASIPSVAAIYDRIIPSFSVTRSMSPSASRYVYDSAPQTFNPPTPNEPYGYTVIACMNVSGVAGQFAQSLIRTNGLENLYRHENLAPSSAQNMLFSIAGTGDISQGQSVTATFAVASAQAGTATFAPTRLFCIFSGSIL